MLRCSIPKERKWPRESGRPDLTEEVFRHGWLHTGDVGVRDADGFIRIVDRLKDMIITGGFNVYPREVEDALTSHPAVSAAGVFGIADDHWGEAVTAAVVLREGHSASIADLTAHVRAAKGVHQTPKVIHFLDALPLTPVGKPDKKALRARYS
jgi:acyl-CoA synthetase (AMP-forming)/AMP-acid ligase II